VNTGVEFGMGMRIPIQTAQETTSSFNCEFVMILEGNIQKGKNQYHGTKSMVYPKS
jgi:hypothetical protein